MLLGMIVDTEKVNIKIEYSSVRFMRSQGGI